MFLFKKRLIHQTLLGEENDWGCLPCVLLPVRETLKRSPVDFLVWNRLQDGQREENSKTLSNWHLFHRRINVKEWNKLSTLSSTCIFRASQENSISRPNASYFSDQRDVSGLSSKI